MSRYTDKVEANTPPGYTLVCGWSFSEYGYGPEEYRDMLVQTCEDLDDEEAPPTFPSYREWAEKGTEDADDLGFSHSTCDLCGGLPGNRHAVSALSPDLKESIALAVCPDCLMYVANGDEPDEEYEPEVW